MNNSIRGFTLLEAMVVVAVLAVVTALAAPSMRSFIVRNKVASISNEFSSALTQTRALAVAKNSCASICAATNVSSTSTAPTPTCKAGAADFQTGWMIFVNPTCDATQDMPEADDVAVLRLGETGSGYTVQPSSNALNTVMFDPRGLAVLGGAGSFQVNPPTGADDEFKRTICLDAAGRPSVRKTKSSGTCS